MPNLIIVFICEPVNIYLCTFSALRIKIRESASVRSRFFYSGREGEVIVTWHR